MDRFEEIRKRKMEELGEKISKPVADKPIEITDENFEQTIKDNPAIVIDFWARWCMPCLALAPTIERLAKKFAGKVVFGKLDVNGNRETAVKFEVTVIPTLLFFKNGRVVERVSGAVSQEILEPMIKKMLT
jgi:thioredoxin 1